MKRRSFLQSGVAAIAAAKVPAPDLSGDAALRARICRADLVYDRPVARSEEGMPLGNGRMGTLVWTTPTQIRFQINRVDVYANNCSSNSFFERNNDYCGGCAYVEIDFGSWGHDPFAGNAFHQRLNVYDGTITVTGNQVQTDLLASPHRDVLAARIHSIATQSIQVKMRMLRHSTQSFAGRLEEFASEHIAAVETRNHLALSQLLIRGDRIVLSQEFREGNHYNKSAVAIGIEGTKAKAEIADETQIRLIAASGAPFTVLLASASSFDPNADVVADALAQLEAGAFKGYSALAVEGKLWWHAFWSRGSLHLESPDGTAQFLEANYHYFLYVMAASSRGKYPPKFNGMIWNTGGDLRTWGAQHWFANLSCYYEALFAANRLELLDPVFEMYFAAFDTCATAARQQWGSQGIYIPETMYFDGLERLPVDVAAEMQKLYLMEKPWAERTERFRAYSGTKHPHSSRWNWVASGKWADGRWATTERGSGPYGNVSHIFGTTAKVAYLFWRRFEFTQDRKWLETRAYPMLKGAAEFYRNHPNVSKESDGKYHIRYANSNESVWGARDTDEDLSAMRGVFGALLRASEMLNADSESQPAWREFLANLTPLPASTDADALRPEGYAGPAVFARARKPSVKGGTALLPDQNSLPQWFFDLCNPDASDRETLRLANQSFDAWFKNPIDSTVPVGVLSKLPIAGATLGRPEAVRHLIANQVRTIRPERGTAYKNGAVLLNRMTLREGPQALDAQRLGRAAEALHLGLLQSAPPAPGADAIIRLYPAWPNDWKARFQLLARGGFEIDSAFEGGSVTYVRIRSLAGADFRLVNPWGTAHVTLERNGVGRETLAGEMLAFPTSTGEQIMMRRLVK